MAYITTEAATVPRNFLASEVGLTLKTVQVDDTGITADEYGYKTVEAGTIYPSNDKNAKGIVFENADVTHYEHAASIIVAGRIIKSNLPVTPTAAAITALEASGIVFEDAEPGAVRGEIVPLDYTAGTTGFTAADIAKHTGGDTLTITAIGTDNDTAIATVALASGTVTATKVKAGSTQITCTVSDSAGFTTDIVVPITIE